MVSGRTRRERQRRHARRYLHSKQPTTFKESGRVTNDNEWLAFRAWLQATRPPRMYLTMAEFSSTGRGMMATRDIMPGDNLVEIPKQLLITSDSLRSYYCDALSRCKTPPKTHALMAYHLAVETSIHGRSSRQWPYLAVLPRDFNTLPICYPNSLQRLLPSSVQDMIRQQQTAIDESYSQLCQDMLSNNHALIKPTKEVYQWGWLNVNTRCVYMDKGVNAPVSDRIMKAYYNKETECYTITTENTFLRGQQAFISYGPHDNGFLLGEYGFVTPKNKYNQWVLSLEDVQQSVNLVLQRVSLVCKPWYQWLRHAHHDTVAKLEFLTQHGLVDDYAFYEDGHPPSRLLAALRILFLPQFNQHSASTLNVIQQWQHVLYDSLDDELTLTSYPVTNKFLRYFIRELCQHAIEQAQTRIDQLTSLFPQLPLTYQLAWQFTRQLWHELQSIAEKTTMQLYN
ncbi:hypothetical protein BDF22DRAFT_663254 [Syncephalis plumigaleata]|nr:hypothetical protein BDF22DRAFT_663254 [Syncephalis plumigaleata]